MPELRDELVALGRRRGAHLGHDLGVGQGLVEPDLLLVDFELVPVVVHSHGRELGVGVIRNDLAVFCRGEFEGEFLAEDVSLCSRSELVSLRRAADVLRADLNGSLGLQTASFQVPDNHAHAASSSDRRAAPAAPAADAESSSIRVSVERIDSLINQVGELVITQAMLAQLTSVLDPAEHERIYQALTQLEHNTRELQEAVMSIRMLPISFVFNRFPRLVRDTCGKLGKQVELVLRGEHTELDKGVIEKLTDPLTHIVRNSIDHGIELPAERLEAGKPAMGTVRMSAFHQGGRIVVEISDDGKGLSRERILAKAKEQGMPVSDDMPDSEVWQLIFMPGFSTAEAVTDLSGRGVGMDVVRRNITSIGGRIDINSVAGQGTHIAIRLPLTLAILDGMIVEVDKVHYVVPLTYIVESLQLKAEHIYSMSGSSSAVISVRNEYLPLLSLHRLLNLAAEPPPTVGGIVLILEAEGNTFALQVDDLIGQQQVVIKSLEQNFRRVDGITGATIMGDGSVALILDVDALPRLASQGTPNHA